MDAFFCFPLDGPITGGGLIREGGGGRISGSLRYSAVFCILNSTTFRCNIREKKKRIRQIPSDMELTLAFTTEEECKTMLRAFHKLLEIFQKVSRNFSKCC